MNKLDRKEFLCPKCKGTGKVRGYVSFSDIAYQNITDIQCQSCHGSGVILEFEKDWAKRCAAEAERWEKVAWELVSMLVCVNCVGGIGWCEKCTTNEQSRMESLMEDAIQAVERRNG